MTDESATDSEHSGAFSNSSSANSLSEENETLDDDPASMGYLSLPANNRQDFLSLSSAQASPEVESCLDGGLRPTPRSSSLNSLVSDVSVAGSLEPSALETSSEGSNNAFVQNVQNSNNAGPAPAPPVLSSSSGMMPMLPNKPPTPTVAPITEGLMTNLFLPTGYGSSETGSVVQDQQPVFLEAKTTATPLDVASTTAGSTPQEPPATIEGLDAQEIFFNIEQLTNSLTRDSFDFTKKFESAVKNKEKFTSNVGKTVVGITNKASSASKKMEFFKALASSTSTDNEKNVPKQTGGETSNVPTSGGSGSSSYSPRAPSFVRSFSKDLKDNFIAPAISSSEKESIKNGNTRHNIHISNQQTNDKKPVEVKSLNIVQRPEVQQLTGSTQAVTTKETLKKPVTPTSLSIKNGNAIKPPNSQQLSSSSRPLSPKYDISFPEDLPAPAKVPSPRSTRKGKEVKFILLLFDMEFIFRLQGPL